MACMRTSARRRTWRGSPSYGVRSGVRMSQNIRPTPCASGRQGSTANVLGSGMAIMSDSSIALKPVIDEPSKPIPPSNASSSSSLFTEKLFSCPRMSVNHRRMKRMSRSSTIALTSAAVLGWSGMARTLTAAAPTGGPGLLASWAAEPLASPLLQGADGGLERAALLGEAVLHAHGRAVEDAALHHSLGLELLQPLGEQAVGKLGDELPDPGEMGRPVEQHEDDRAGPALADQLDSPVVQPAAGLPRRIRRLLCRVDGHAVSVLTGEVG